MIIFWWLHISGIIKNDTDEEMVDFLMDWQSKDGGVRRDKYWILEGMEVKKCLEAKFACLSRHSPQDKDQIDRDADPQRDPFKPAHKARRRQTSCKAIWVLQTLQAHHSTVCKQDSLCRTRDERSLALSQSSFIFRSKLDLRRRGPIHS